MYATFFGFGYVYITLVRLITTFCDTVETFSLVRSKHIIGKKPTYEKWLHPV